jgi:hypothetical protein
VLQTLKDISKLSGEVAKNPDFQNEVINRAVTQVTAQLKPLVDVINCHESIHVTKVDHIDVTFLPAECNNKTLKPNWTYFASLEGTNVCGGTSEYQINVPKMAIRFWAIGVFCDAVSDVSVQFIGFDPRIM